MRMSALLCFSHGNPKNVIRSHNHITSYNCINVTSKNYVNWYCWLTLDSYKSESSKTIK